MAVVRLLSRLARSGLFTERIIRLSDADVSSRCLKYLDQRGDTEMLMRVARARAKVDPSDWRAQYHLARTYRLLGDEEAGLEAAGKAANCPDAPNSARLYFARFLWNKGGQPDDTVRQIVHEILHEAPETALAHWLQARICLHDGEIGAAYTHADAALAAQPEDARFQALKAKIEALLAAPAENAS